MARAANRRFFNDFAWPELQIDGCLMISLGQGCKSAVLGPNLGIWRPENEEIVLISLKIQLFGISSCWFFHENSIHLNKKCWPAQHLRAKSTKNILQTLRFEPQKPRNPRKTRCKRYDLSTKKSRFHEKHNANATILFQICLECESEYDFNRKSHVFSMSFVGVYSPLTGPILEGPPAQTH